MITPGLITAGSLSMEALSRHRRRSRLEIAGRFGVLEMNRNEVFTGSDGIPELC